MPVPGLLHICDGLRVEKLRGKILVSQRKSWYHYKQECFGEFKEAEHPCQTNTNVRLKRFSAIWKPRKQNQVLGSVHDANRMHAKDLVYVVCHFPNSKRPNGSLLLLS